jgi:hypothetical protein
MASKLTINPQNVVHETIDGETILIHLGTGTYYSLDGVGAQIWGLLAAGASQSEVAADVASASDADRAAVEQAVESLVEELLREELLALAPGDSAPGDAAPGGSTSEPSFPLTASKSLSELAEPEPAVGVPFVAPVLRKYTDMQEFRLVDPIHDVDVDAGWPHVKAG